MTEHIGKGDALAVFQGGKRRSKRSKLSKKKSGGGTYASLSGGFGTLKSGGRKRRSKGSKKSGGKRRKSKGSKKRSKKSGGKRRSKK